MLENLYSGAFKRLATYVPTLCQTSPQVKSLVTHNILSNRFVKVWKHTQPPKGMQR